MTARSLGWAGLAAGPAAWATSTQLNYAIVPWACARSLAWIVIPGIAAVLIALVLAGGLLSWRAWRATPSERREAGGLPHHFLASLGMGMAALFGLVIALQATGTLFFTGCEW